MTNPTSPGGEGIVLSTLRIKRIYFDRILSGDKKIEFRDYKDFYHRLFKKNPTHLILHYQGKRKLLVEVSSVEVIPTPDRLKESKIKFSEKVYAIHLGRSGLIK